MKLFKADSSVFHSPFFFVLLILSIHANAQNPCPNIDFELGNFANWRGQLGSCCPISTTSSSIVPGRQTIMTGTSRDTNTCFAVPVTYPGEGTYSARLGNDNIGAEAEQLSYTFIVPSNSLFIYRYAVVLEDPSHSPSEQPRFEIRVLDASGTLIDPVCGYYSVVASAIIPGFQSCQTVRYKNWTTVGIDLSPYIGQSVTIEFSTGDCSLGGHFGYAYIDAACSSLQIINSYCSNTSSPATLTAPEGFSYQWSTGDTSRSIVITNPVQGSTYSVVLISVTGCTATLSTQIIATSVAAGFGVTANCSKHVAFADSSTGLNSTVTAWKWYFGDGDSSSQQNPQHAYAAGGLYNVTLVAFSSQGCSDTILKTIQVIPSPDASFIVNSGCTGTVTNMVSTSSVASGTLTSWSWNAGNGMTSAGTTGSFIYNLPGGYPVRLVVMASNGCSDTITQTVNILDFPVVQFSASDTAGCNPFEVFFTDLTSPQGNTALSWLWNFGDSTSSTRQHPSHVFTTAGYYNISLSVTNGNGCSTTQLVPNMINVYEQPVASFITNPENTSIIYPKISFVNQSLYSTWWSWDFGDSTGTSGPQVMHTYSATGHYLVTLVAGNPIGCTDTATKDIYIRPELVLYAPNAFTPNGDDKNETFYLHSTGVTDFYFAIFNRWGELVFETNQVSDQWNGQVKNNGNPVPAGVYYWIANVKDELMKPQQFSGSISLLR